MTPEKAFKVLKNTLASIRIGHVQYTKALHLAMAALQKQIPKKPVPIIGKYTGTIVSYKCPDCGARDLGNGEFQYNCCEHCGQALDWSDIE